MVSSVPGFKSLEDNEQRAQAALIQSREEWNLAQDQARVKEQLSRSWEQVSARAARLAASDLPDTFVLRLWANGIALLRGKAIGGPRSGVTLEAPDHRIGTVFTKTSNRNGWRGVPTRYRGRYIWCPEDSTWRWSPDDSTSIPKRPQDHERQHDEYNQPDDNGTGQGG